MTDNLKGRGSGKWLPPFPLCEYENRRFETTTRYAMFVILHDGKPDCCCVILL